MDTTKYAEKAIGHLEEEAVKISFSDVKAVHQKSKEMLASIMGILSENEYGYIKKTIDKCEVPTVRLLIKDHNI